MAWWTSEEKLRKYFENYGVVLKALIIRNTDTGRSRGFGFVFFADPSVFHRVLLQDTHIIDGQRVGVERALFSEEQLNPFRSGISKTKIFVGGLPPTLTEEEFSGYFKSYGRVTDAVIMPNTGKPYRIGFISFDSEDAVHDVLHKMYHKLNGKLVQVKRVHKKNEYSRNYPGYGASSTNTSTYEGRMDSGRYMYPQHSGGGFLAYGSSANAAPGYGYGVTHSGVGYGGYGSAASRIAPDFGGAAGIGGSFSVTMGQSPIGASGYRNQSYTNRGGFGPIRRPAGSASNRNAGAGGVEQQGTSYGYSDANGNSGYRNAVGTSNYVHATGSYGTAQASGSQILEQQDDSRFVDCCLNSLHLQ
ncbi:hypothetical protein HHK36_022489 [Tetracentron sinense]|uniref:RRM domain-containing protein n=1 Tax=Tetracentron sinense TaxID=13715 RepID=A0A835D8V8_TETSI|nr:hypothetical protein HHK36_022489 [Tetracentron sinense]